VRYGSPLGVDCGPIIVALVSQSSLAPQSRTVPLGRLPLTLTVAERSGHLFVTDSLDGTVSMLGVRTGAHGHHDGWSRATLAGRFGGDDRGVVARRQRRSVRCCATLSACARPAAAASSSSACTEAASAARSAAGSTAPTWVAPKRASVSADRSS
jgi:hypothetical protein